MAAHYPDTAEDTAGCIYAPPPCPNTAPSQSHMQWVTAWARGLTLFAALGCAPPQAVLQQLVGAGRAGTCHQAHSGLVEEDLEGKVRWKMRGGLAEGQCCG